MSFAPLRAALMAVPFLLAACSGAGSESGETANSLPSKAEAKADKLLTASDMVIGAEDAPVTVIEYASVTCPHCAAFHETIFPGIKEKYVDTGKVRFAFREFPTPPQGLSYVGSVLARCAAEKGGSDAYFLIIGTLFKTQKTWIYGEDPRLELVKVAAQAGMDEAAFDACMQRQDLVDLINANVSEAAGKYDIDSTPSFVVDGDKLTPIRSQEDFEEKLDAALAKAAG
jgi:protein-disulfide isomerase